MAIAQGIGHVPPHAGQNNLLGKMRAFEADRHRYAPSLISPDHAERSYRKWLQMRIATQPANPPHHASDAGRDGSQGNGASSESSRSSSIQGATQTIH